MADAHTGAEVSVAQRKSLRIARFLNRLIFCFFSEDTDLLPKQLFSELARTALDDPHHLSRALEALFRAMATGGLFGAHKFANKGKAGPGDRTGYLQWRRDSGFDNDRTPVLQNLEASRTKTLCWFRASTTRTGP